jgi:hypothetical protein
MAVRVPEIDYYSQHGIWGAYASLVLGRLGKPAGMVVGGVRPPRTGLFVGYQHAGKDPRFLPFSSGQSYGLGAAAYREDEAAPPQDSPESRRRSWFEAGEIERLVSLSGEEWRAGALSFRLVSFFGEVPDPRGMGPEEAREALRPAIYARLAFDNSRGEGPMTGLFAMQGINRPLSDSTSGELLGMASGTSWGFAVRPSPGVEEVMDWSVAEAAFDGGNRPLRRLASEGGLRFGVPAGEKAEYLVAIGAFRGGIVTSGRPAHAYHSCLFRDLEEVLEVALEAPQSALRAAERLDAALEAAGLGDDRSFLLAHAAHSYLANTELLLSEAGEPLFVVNEGEYQMMNTLDLTIDHAFWEARFSPWTLRNELDSFLEFSSYRDGLGLAFAHDQGLADGFTPPGRSTYELPGLTDCFSYMSYEETLNWAISACLYASLSGDSGWARERRKDLADCLGSIKARDANGDGVMDRDSDRCSGGAEITTYDSLDISLGQARNNLYLAVKAWSALVCLEALFRRLEGEASEEARGARESAQAAALTIAGRMLGAEGFIPAVFESDNRSRIIPAIEGLAYPGFCGAPEALGPEGPYAGLIEALRRHLDTVLSPGLCLDAVSGGWKLSSTSHITWLSKIFLNQYVAEEVLGLEGDERVRRDAVHARWLRLGSADFAATDQVDSATGADLGSRLYPRLVTSVLWLKPIPAKG